MLKTVLTDSGLYDIHSHILYGVDDGAPNEEEALKMLETAYMSGTRTMILTPHYHPGKSTPDAGRIMEIFMSLSEYVRKVYPGFYLFPGQEIYCYSGMISDLREKRTLTMAGSNYVLIEYSLLFSFPEIRDSIRENVNAGYIPIIAHAERYPVLVENPDYIFNLIAEGAYIQVNADSLTGGIFSKERRFVLGLLKKGLVHFIASDAHSNEGRPPDLAGAFGLVSRHFGSGTAKKIFCENPEAVIRNEII